MGQLGSAAMPQPVTVTPEEREAIERVSNNSLYLLRCSCECNFVQGVRGAPIIIITNYVNIVLQLEAMGFDRALVLEVYFACNKNEELAANYLLDHMHEFEE